MMMRMMNDWAVRGLVGIPSVEKEDSKMAYQGATLDPAENGQRYDGP
jgi:hypothetical protein